MGVTPRSPILQQRPNDYGIPMDVEVAYIQDGFLTNDVLQEMVSVGWGPQKTPSTPARTTPRPHQGLAGPPPPVPVLPLAPVTATVSSPSPPCCRGLGAAGAACLSRGQPRCLQPLSPLAPDAAGGVL